MRKATVLLFQAKNKRNFTPGLRKGQLKRETESVRIAAQNNAIRKKYVKAKKKKKNETKQKSNKIANVGYVDT